MINTLELSDGDWGAFDDFPHDYYRDPSHVNGDGLDSTPDDYPAAYNQGQEEMDEDIFTVASYCGDESEPLIAV
ncbi:MAG: hypothetical protein ABII00_07350 [Elusimicrobiota bacterium]